MRHVVHMDVMCQKYEWNMSRKGIGHVTPINRVHHTYDWVMSRIWTWHGTRMQELWHTIKDITSHIRMDESCHTYGCVMSRVWMWVRCPRAWTVGIFCGKKKLMHTSFENYRCAKKDPCICQKRYVYMWKWHIHMSKETYLCMKRDQCLC